MTKYKYDKYCLSLLLVCAATHAQGGACSISDDCLNDGTCYNLGATDHADLTAYCGCATGFVGVNCEHSCPLNCQNEGQCGFVSDDHAYVAGDTDYVCKCGQGFTGALCQYNGSTSANKSLATDNRLSSGAVVGIVASVLSSLVVLSTLATRWRRITTEWRGDGRTKEMPRSEDGTTGPELQSSQESPSLQYANKQVV
jgi:hypothetical protein